MNEAVNLLRFTHLCGSFTSSLANMCYILNDQFESDGEEEKKRGEREREHKKKVVNTRMCAEPHKRDIPLIQRVLIGSKCGHIQIKFKMICR